MAVNYNQGLGTWQVDGRGHYPTEEAAREADAAKAAGEKVETESYSDDEFVNSFDAPSQVKAPPPRATSPDGLTYLDTGEPTPLAIRREQAQRGEITSRDFIDTGFVPTQANRDQYEFDAARGQYYIKGSNPRVYITNDPAQNDRAANTATFTVGRGADGGLSLSAGDPSQMPAGQRVGTAAEADQANRNYQTTGNSGYFNNATGGAAGSTAPISATTPRYNDAARATEGAEDRFNTEQEKNATENQNLFSSAMDRFNNLGGGQYGLSDEARGYQQEGLAQQRMLLEKLLGFDERQYAAQFGDEALARTIAAGRQGTSAAEQQVGRFAAMEQAPALYAEGRRQASELANQRLAMAEQAATSFGELGTATRGQDETRAQFEAQLPLEIARSVSDLTQGKLKLNQEESKMFGDMWMDFAQLQSIYAGMSSQEQIAWWREESARRGQDKVLEGILRELKSRGEISDKDILNGLFQLGGGLLGLGGRLGAS